MFYLYLLGRSWSRAQLRVKKRDVGQTVVKEEAKMKKRGVFRNMFWSGDGQEYEKEAFFWNMLVR